MLEKSEVNCRKIYSRAKRKLKNDLAVHPENTEHVDFLAKTFIEVSMTGNFDEMINALAEDVVLVTDGGGNVPSALYPIVNKKRVFAFIKGVTAKASFVGELLPVMVNGQTGILQIKDGQPIRVVSLELDSERNNMRSIYIVSNPEKLTHISVP